MHRVLLALILALTVSTTQRGDHAQLVVGTFDAQPTALHITLPPGWSGAPATVTISGTALLTFDLVRSQGAPQVGVVRVSGGGMAAHAYLAGAILESAPPGRRVWLPVIRR